MFRTIMADIDVKNGIFSVLKRIDEAFLRRSGNGQGTKPLLVAVGKTKPAEMIVDAYSVGQRHFGENYVQELIEKGSHPLILDQCPQIKWHFIGHLQSNKINKVIKVPGLYMIETVDSEKLANSLNSAWERVDVPNKDLLRVLVQVNTSGEAEKNGVDPKDAAQLYKHIRENLPNLKVEGVMTIGRIGHDYSTGPNPDFITLTQCHNDICKICEVNPEDVHVSMGMSDDFEKAIEMGSTIVRVGSSIFGFRPKKTVSH